jgi:glycosyltransferase involved in cell wall biosynthesis
MRILVLAPHPYFEVRGSPIDLDNLLRELSARADTEVDLLTYAEGADRRYPNVSVVRIAALPLMRNVRPGFSLKKLVCDLFMFWKAWSLIRRRRYQLLHAVEETAFMALVFRTVFGIPYVYDLDSSLAQQMVESIPALRPGAGLLDAMERLAIRQALVAAPVCNALRDRCMALGARKVVTLHDISQLEAAAPRTGNLSREVGTDRSIVLYSGNLEPYQGMDLLLRAFAIVARATDALDLVVIGGIPKHVSKYRRMVSGLGLDGRVHLLGSRPLEELGGYLADADILAAPRIAGINTPMKVFSYLHSGRPVVATDLPTHSQILTREVAVLAKAEPEAFAEALLRLAGDAALRKRIGRAGRAFVEANHTFDAHQRRVNELYDWVEAQIGADPGCAAARPSIVA